jgi:hypothetical protein
MRYGRIASALSAATIAALLAACGGGSSTSALPKAAVAQMPASASKTRATLQVTIPPKTTTSSTQRSPQYVSAATQSMAVVFTPVGGGTPQTFDLLLTTANPQCSATLVSSLVCNVTFNVTAGSYMANFTTYDGVLGANGAPTGNVLSQNQNIAETIADGAVNALPNVTLQGIPKSIVLTYALTNTSGALTGSATAGFALSAPAPCSTATPTPAQVSLVAVDADGNYIIGAGAPAASLVSSDTTHLVVTAPSTATPTIFGVGAPLGVTASAAVTLTATFAPGGGGTAISQTFATAVSPGHCIGTFATLPTVEGTNEQSISDLARDASGNFYSLDGQNRTVVKTTPGGVSSVFAGGNTTVQDGTGTAAGFSAVAAANRSGAGEGNFPTLGLQALAIDGNGVLYVGDSGTIRTITPAGVVTTLAGTVGASTATPVDGTVGSGGTATFDNIEAIDVLPSGAIYFADGNSVRSLINGIVTTIAGSAGTSGATNGSALAARFKIPSGIAVDPVTLNIYVSDYGNALIRLVSGGTVTTFAGSTQANSTGVDGIGSAATLGGPMAMKLGSNGILYFVDNGWEFNPGSEMQLRSAAESSARVTTIAGTTSQGRAFVNGAVGTAHLGNAYGLVLGSNGTLYYVDDAAIQEYQ